MFRIQLFRFFLLLLTSVSVSVSTLGQEACKMNYTLARKAQDLENQNEIVSLFVKGDPAQVRAAVSELGGILSYSAGDVSVVHISLQKIALLGKNEFVKRMEARIPRTEQMNDSMRIKANIDPVQAGQLPLTQGYDGTGVVIGIIDTGIDFTNPDFKNSLNRTRVKYIWDQRKPLSGNTPAKYGYGQDWDSTQINAGQCTSTDIADFGHGTATSGIAAGNGNGSPGHKYRGAAPNADLIVVALDFNSNSSTLITDAVDYIYAKAVLLGEPCVINLSLGDYYGSHDGLDLQAQMMNNLLMAQPGRAMVGSAGNAGGQFIHLGYNLSATDTNFTWFQLGTDSLIEIWADTLNFTNAKMAIGADKHAPDFLFRGNTKFIGVSDNRGILRQDTLFNSSGQRIAIVESNTAVQGSAFDITFRVLPDSNMYGYYWRLMLFGEGRFDLWADSMVKKNLPKLFVFPSIAAYKMPDTLQTLLTSFQCLDNVVTVANMNNKKTYLDANSVRVEPFSYIRPDNIDRSSSIGPTRDGRVKPDIAAPGSLTMSTGVLSLVKYADSAAPASVEQSGYVRAGGTSASGPVVAGIAALYLQKYPAAGAADVRNAIIACPKTDAFTGSVPNPVWGYGKVDAFATLSACVTGINPIAGKNIKCSIYPNPFSEETILAYDLTEIGEYNSARLVLYDITGRIVRTLTLTNKSSKLTIQRAALDSGCYLYKLIIDGTIFKSDKFLIL